MTAQGHPRHFERAQATSGLHPTPEVSLRCGEPTFRANQNIGGGDADTSSHGRECFVISLNSNDGAMRFRLLKAIEAGL